ncbi:MULTISPECIES: hypothetical protein [Citrobacter]|uniref:Uncharacterized protein n=1 Tax=Citrobacter braakii TaxID=57706 RepID=A0ABR6TP57_CITBR|nr:MULTISPECIES: hypothetical protein [Citrobacter]MBC2608560.1 hypothetical protein [Citrobacter braakii]MBC2632601.1 hypothetical protein [Citrobacter braakii]MBC2645317.1 hypothetical protein [Citrobacter braakii]MDM3431585.1 hypothetical protein [Citrobacter sp. Cb023]MDM3435670.1 hypothetical protein [Citrobacter sp. Cb034]
MRYSIVPFKKNPATLIFFAGLILSFLIPFSFYLSLNRVVPYLETNAPTTESVIYGVDECSYSDGILKVNGWATDKEGYGSILVSADIDGKKIYLRTSIENRPDVSQYFKKPGLYDRSGFSSSLNVGSGFNKINISIHILRNGKNHEIKHECK